MKNPLHKKIAKALIYAPTYQEIADLKGHTRQSITPIMKKIPKEVKDTMKAKRLKKIKDIIEG